MLERFIKYQSLGNDFILLDWQDRSESFISEWTHHSHRKSCVVNWCDRHRGIGADGVLILKRHIDGLPEMLIFNSDGSQAQICLNGIRCCAHYLSIQEPKNQNNLILCGNQTIIFEIASNKLQIMTRVASPIYEKSISIQTSEGVFNGHCVNVGNPHFVVLEKKELSWLSQHGALIERHLAFEQKTNVEFVWQEVNNEPGTYRVLVYERGCGITQSCSSGAAAITCALLRLGMIHTEQRINLHMLGGVLESMVSQQGDISLLGTAYRVFSGECFFQ
jgi:diaminopimelate epimerase